MTPLPFWQAYKNKWLATQDAKLKAEFAPQLAALQETCQRQVGDLQQQSAQFKEKYQELERMQVQLADQEQILSDRRIAVEKANEELRTQLRLLEAKAAPDRVWVEAFSRGYQIAWETMWPIMADGVQNLRSVIEQKAIEETLTRLDPLIAERAGQLGVIRPQAIQTVLQKQTEFQQKRETAKSVGEQEKYDHYLTAMEWFLHADGLHSNQPAA